jgi:hypothetical protein
MDKLIEGLGPAFAAGFAVQQLLEIIAPVLERFWSGSKKILMGLISLAAGLALSFYAGLKVLKPFGVDAPFIDLIVTGLIISAGTEGINSVLKFMGYYKQKEKADAAMKVNEVAGNESAAKAMKAM